MFSVYSSNVLEKEYNTSYKRKIEINNLDDMKQAVSHDYVSICFKDHQRSNDNFMESDCIIMDIDNDHSDDPSRWIGPEKIGDVFPDVEYCIHFSRHHLIAKGNKEARPKFHVLFPIKRCSNGEDYKAIKLKILRFCKLFDRKAIDNGHFFYGTKEPQVMYFKGGQTIDDFIEIYDLNELNLKVDGRGEIHDDINLADSREILRFPIEEGSRNNAMFNLGRKFIMRHDDTGIAYGLFLEQAKYCNPPLDDRELHAIWSSLKKRLANLKAQGKYLSPKEFFKNNVVLKTLKPKNFSDYDQAVVFSKYFMDKIAYSDATSFLIYKGSHWEEDDVTARRFAQILTDEQLKEADKLFFDAENKIEGLDGGFEGLKKRLHDGTATDEEKRLASQYQDAKDYKSYILKRRNSGKIQSSLNELAPIVQFSIKELDKDEFLLSTPAATYDLREGLNGARTPSPKDMLTKITGVSPSGRGKDLWLKFLGDVFDDDQELIDYVQMICGVCAIGKVYIEGIIISYGDGGNGKSTFWNTVAKALGSYYGKISADALTTNCKRNVKPELAELRGKRLIIASESQEGARLDDGGIKELCSTDDIRGEKKYKAPFDFTPTHTLVLYTNHLPKVKGVDDGIWRRIIVIPFNHKFTKDNADIKNYSDILFEESGEYVLSWIIEGAKKVYDSKFKIKNPKVVQEAIDSYKKDNDWFGKFVDNCCEANPGEECKSSDLYQAYRAYATSQGEYPRGTIEFYTELERRGFRKVPRREHGVRLVFVKGLSIINADAIDDFSFLQ